MWRRFLSVVSQRPATASCGHAGLQQFFPEAVTAGATGRSWSAAELRNKSNEDLHKLWYVLIKERNMLLTLQQECKVQLAPMPGPERFKKVRLSMNHINVVVSERARALAAAAAENPAAWTATRAAAGLPATMRASPPARRLLSGKEQIQLGGVARAGLARPLQPQRKMTKPERFAFHHALKAQRRADTRTATAAINNELAAASPENVRARLAAAEAKLQAGFRFRDLPLADQLAIRAAQARGFPTIHE